MRPACYALTSSCLLVWTALAATGCGTKTSDGGGTDSNTHWLGRCAADADCEGELSCVCGACTSDCATDSSCESLDVGAICLDVRCNESDEQGVCTLGCSKESDCPSGAICEGGACVPRLAEVSSSDDPDAGDAPEDLCAPTTFTQTPADCVDGKWLWNGSACVHEGPCGCLVDECDRLYDDEATCQAAHTECLAPN